MTMLAPEEKFKGQSKGEMKSISENKNPLVILRHINCHDTDCHICMEDHEKLGEVLTKLTGNDKVDHLGKYHLWLSKHNIEPETEWGWATAESFKDKNIEQYVHDFLKNDKS